MKMMTGTAIPHRCLQMAGLGVADSMMQLFGVELLRAGQHPRHRSIRNIYQWVQSSLWPAKFLGQSN